MVARAGLRLCHHFAVALLFAVFEQQCTAITINSAHNEVSQSRFQPQFKQTLDVDWFSDRAVDNIAIITVANFAFIDSVKSWIKHIERLKLTSIIPQKNLSIVCVDEKLKEGLQEIGQPCHLLQRKDQNAGDFGGIAMLRHYVASVLNTHGLDVLYTDADALWYQNPLPMLRAAAPRDASPGIVAGPASDHIPEVCTGVIFFHGSLPKTFWDSVEEFVFPGGNDQHTFNKMLKRLGVDWNAPIVNLYDYKGRNYTDIASNFENDHSSEGNQTIDPGTNISNQTDNASIGEIDLIDLSPENEDKFDLTPENEDNFTTERDTSPAIEDTHDDITISNSPNVATISKKDHAFENKDTMESNTPHANENTHVDATNMTTTNNQTEIADTNVSGTTAKSNLTDDIATSSVNDNENNKGRVDSDNTSINQVNTSGNQTGISIAVEGNESNHQPEVLFTQKNNNSDHLGTKQGSSTTDDSTKTGHETVSKKIPVHTRPKHAKRGKHHRHTPRINFNQVENSSMANWPKINTSKPAFQIAYWEVPNMDVNVALLPQHAFPRQCKKLHPREVVIFHCASATGVAGTKILDPKIKGLEKTDVLDQLWKIYDRNQAMDFREVTDLELMLNYLDSANATRVIE